MRIIETKVYTFDELGERAKEKARDWWREGGLQNEDAWNHVKEDAHQIGLKIISLDDRRANEGEFLDTALSTLEKILVYHGPNCETHKTAERYRDIMRAQYKRVQDTVSTLEDDHALKKNKHEFLHDLLEDYRIMLEREIDYQNSNECVDENILANEYEFTEDGKRA